jgi:YD repeat-containing protein
MLVRIFLGKLCSDWLIQRCDNVHACRGLLWKASISSVDQLHLKVSRALGNQLTATQQYDKMGRLTQQTLAGKTEQTRSYQYDPVGQLLGISDSRSGQTSYRYDPVGRLVAAASPHANETFAFDPASNIIDTKAGIASQASSNNLPGHIPALVGNLLKEYAGTHFKYDARGNLVEKQQGEQVQKLAWDGFNRLTALETSNGKTEYAYDVFGRRIGKKTATGVTTFAWDGDVIALKKTADHTRHYLFEPNSTARKTVYKPVYSKKSSLNDGVGSRNENSR